MGKCFVYCVQFKDFSLFSGCYMLVLFFFVSFLFMDLLCCLNSNATMIHLEQLLGDCTYSVVSCDVELTSWTFLMKGIIVCMLISGLKKDSLRRVKQTQNRVLLMLAFDIRPPLFKLGRSKWFLSNVYHLHW